MQRLPQRAKHTQRSAVHFKCPVLLLLLQADNRSTSHPVFQPLSAVTQDPLAADFLMRLLWPHPMHRMTAEQALQHPYLADAAAEAAQQQAAKQNAAEQLVQKLRSNGRRRRLACCCGQPRVR